MFLFDPLLIKWLIDRVIPARDFRLLLVTALGFFALYLCRLAFAGVAAVVSFRAAQKLVFRIRLNILEHLNRLSADYHEATPPGEKLYRIERDTDQIAELGSSLLPSVFQAVCESVFVVGVMFVLDFRLAWMIVALLPPFFGFRWYFESHLRQASDSAQQLSSRESSFLQEHLGSVIQIQLMHQEEAQRSVFLARAIAKTDALNHQRLVEIVFSVCYMAFIAFGIFIIFGYGGHQVFVGDLTVGGLIAFYSYMASLFGPLGVAVDSYSRLNRLKTNIRRILEITERNPTVREVATAIDFPAPFRGRVDMKRISFAYPDRAPVLHEFDLQIEAGQKIGLVGFNGSGKSTIAKLIARLYDVSRGAVCIDGIDVRQLQLNSLRTKVCYLMQDAILFDGTIKENLLLGRSSATMRELSLAIEIADLDRLVHRLPKGLDTVVGPGGNALSGGERQLLSLARAVLQNPLLLLLDESTAELDVAAERRVIQNLIHHFRHQTVIFVSHRISALRWVDRIVVLNHGVIEEQGSHDQLIGQNGLYTWLHNTPPVVQRRDFLPAASASS